jgi:hypothetical protein
VAKAGDVNAACVCMRACQRKQGSGRSQWSWQAVTTWHGCPGRTLSTHPSPAAASLGEAGACCCTPSPVWSPPPPSAAVAATASLKSLLPLALEPLLEPFAAVPTAPVLPALEPDAAASLLPALLLALEPGAGSMTGREGAPKDAAAGAGPSSTSAGSPSLGPPCLARLHLRVINIWWGAEYTCADLGVVGCGQERQQCAPPAATNLHHACLTCVLPSRQRHLLR